MLPISAALLTETFLDTFGGLDGVDVGVEVGVVSDGFPLDQGVGEGEGFLKKVFCECLHLNCHFR